MTAKTAETKKKATNAAKKSQAKLAASNKSAAKTTATTAKTGTAKAAPAQAKTTSKASKDNTNTLTSTASKAKAAPKKKPASKSKSTAKGKATKTKTNSSAKQRATSKKTTASNPDNTKKEASMKSTSENTKKSVSVKASSKGKTEAQKSPQKITPNNRTIASKGQTKEEQIAKKQAFNKTRTKWFDHYMKGTLPGLFDLRISTNRNVLLSDEEQTNLAKFIQAGIAGKVLLNKVQSEMGKDDPVHLQRTITSDAEHILDCLDKEGYKPSKYINNRRELRKLEKLVSQAESARFVFAEKNLGLVTMIAGRRKKQSNAAAGVDFDDLVAEGMGGLMVAIDHYNPDTGFKFSTPAAWWIEQPIRNYLDSKIYTIHMPTHMNNIYKSIEYAKNALREKFPDDSYITDEAIAEYCQSTGRDITVEKIQEARMYRRETISYDVPFSENDSNEKSISELLSSDEDISLSVLNRIGGRDNFNRMMALIDDDKKREILRDWYSSKDEHDIVILSNVSRKHCLTKERVRQLKQEGEKELFNKLSKMAKKKGVSFGDAIMIDDSDEEAFML